MPGQWSTARRRPPGQNFLAGSALAERLVADVAVGARDRVVEIGAGTGVLTAALARRAAVVVAIEVDPALARDLGRRFASDPQVVVLQGDALGTLEAAWPTSPFRVVANPPFAITTALLHHLLDDPRRALVRADLVVQWQVARQRARADASLAEPGGGADLLGATWTPWWRFARGRRLPASCFRPRARVDAAVLTVMRRDPPLLPERLAGAYAAFVRSEFARLGGRAATRSAADWAERARRDPRLHSRGSSAKLV